MAGRSPYRLPADRLETRFGEKAPPLSKGEAVAEAARCLYCYDAPCIPACPTHIDIPTFIRKIATGNLKGSARTILESNLLGASCARVCPVEVLCEGSCVYTGWGRKPIEIGRLQRYAMDGAASVNLLRKAPSTGRSVGLVGAGPASLACAGALALLGHSPVLYEKEDLPGGLNTTGVAPYKMKGENALAEVDFIRDLGAEIRTGVEVGADVTAEDLLAAHEALFVGIGLGADSKLDVPGADGPGVVGAVEWIRRLKTDSAFSLDGIRNAVVIGGGNTALDAVQELAKLGVRSVRLVYRRRAEEMKGYRHEWSQAKQDGVSIVAEAVVTEVVRGQGASIRELKLVKARGGRPTEEPLDPLPADLVLVAVGQAKLRRFAASLPGVEVDDRGRILVDPETGATGNPRIFAGGDAVNGGKEVVNAAAEGQRAAAGIHARLESATAR